MGIYVPEMPCQFCGKPLGDGKEQLIGFTFFLSSNPLVQELNDAVVHRRCLSQWEKRDDFVKAYNLTLDHKIYGQLKIDRRGQVRYKKGVLPRFFAIRLLIIRLYIWGFYHRIVGLLKRNEACSPATFCPFCNKPLRTSRAKQCPHCGSDWHDSQNIKKLPIR